MDNFKTYLLEKLPFINHGEVGMYMDVVKQRIISPDEVEVGVSDKHGNMFYIRETSIENYRITQQTAPKSYDIYQDFRIVFFLDFNVRKAKRHIINALFNYKIKTFYPITVSSSTTNIGQIMRWEHPHLSTENLLAALKNTKFKTLLLVDFRMNLRDYADTCEWGENNEECN